MKKILILIISLSLAIPSQKLEATAGDKVLFGLIAGLSLVANHINQLNNLKKPTNPTNPTNPKNPKNSENVLLKNPTNPPRPCLDLFTLNGIDRS